MQVYTFDSAVGMMAPLESKKAPPVDKIVAAAKGEMAAVMDEMAAVEGEMAAMAGKMAAVAGKMAAAEDKTVQEDTTAPNFQGRVDH